MEINRNNINKIMLEYYVKPDKDYGQNFLVEPEISKRIVDLLDIKKNERILEVGPGIGSLTHYLTLSNGDIGVVDIDDRMIDFLKEKYPKKHINFISADIRKTDVSTYDKIIGNLPYNITTETIVYLLLNAHKAKRLVIMCQSEAYPHFSDTSGKEYGPASVLLHLVGNCFKKFVVKPSSFYPMPKCTSTVFTIETNDGVDWEQAKQVYLLARQLFMNRRKTIHNNLSQYLKDKEKTAQVLEKCKIEQNTRPEQLSPKQFLEIYLSL